MLAYIFENEIISSAGITLKCVGPSMGEKLPLTKKLPPNTTVCTSLFMSDYTCNLVAFISLFLFLNFEKPLPLIELVKFWQCYAFRSSHTHTHTLTHKSKEKYKRYGSSVTFRSNLICLLFLLYLQVPKNILLFTGVRI